MVFPISENHRDRKENEASACINPVSVSHGTETGFMQEDAFFFLDSLMESGVFVTVLALHPFLRKCSKVYFSESLDF